MFVKKSQEEVDKMTPQEADNYFAQKEQHEKEENEKAIKDALEPLKADLKKANDAVKDLGEQLALEKERATKANETPSDKLKAEFETKKEEIKSIIKGGKEEVEIKALTERASVVNNPNFFKVDGIGQLQHRQLKIADLFVKKPISDRNTNGIITYMDWDKDTSVRAAAMRAEGAVFPESTAKWKKGSIPVEKIGDTLVVTEEFGEDAQDFENELVPFLQTNVALTLDNQIFQGGGTSNELVGLATVAPVYVPTAQGIDFPSHYDLINAVKADITTNTNFIPDFVIMNETCYNQMMSTKDANGNYVMPPFVSKDGMNVSGLDVIISSVISNSNAMLIGQRSKGSLYERVGFTLSEGYTGTQFTQDEKTIKARQRVAFLVRDCEKGAFRYVTNISGNLVTLGS